MIPDYSVIGKRIKQARIENNLTQEQLSDLIDVSVAYMSRVENGRLQINLKRLTQISDVLNVSPGFLLTGSNRNSREYLRADFRELLDSCTSDEQRLIYDIAELVKKSRIRQ